MNEPWTIEMLGSLRARRGAAEEITRFRTRRAGALLAYLALHLGRPHPRALLGELFWPDAEERSQHNNLSIALSSLRRQLEQPPFSAGAVIVADHATVALRPESVTTDVAAFEQDLQNARRARDPAEQIALLTRAVQRYGGDLLPGFYDDWVREAQERLREEFIETLGKLTRLLEDTGDVERALNHARQAVRADPSREAFHHALVRLLVRSGRRGEALARFEDAERALAEYGDVPSTALRDLVRGMRDAEREFRTFPQTGSTPENPTPRTPPPPPPQSACPTLPPSLPAGLPLRITRFFGREEEMDGLTTLLADGEARLITLIGPGGMGKTRLAVEVADRLRRDAAGPLQGRVWFVALAAVADGRRLFDAVHAVLGLPGPEGGETELGQVAAALGADAEAPPALIVLDNFEQIVAEGAPLVRALLARAPNLRCLVTSRRRLLLEGEREFPLLPLPTPAATPAAAASLGSVSPEDALAFTSVQMFVDRARAVRPDFGVTRQNAPILAQLCAGLEGIPLALEMAAARSNVLTPAQMLEHLRDRFTLLIDGRRDAHDRHQTLRAAVDWSHDLLSPERQRFLARLSVFHDGWTVEAAAHVCEPNGGPDEAAAALLALDELQANSFVRAREVNGVMRFYMLETLRVYAAEKLAAQQGGEAERAVCQERHARFYLALAEEAEPHLSGPHQAESLARLDADHDNLRAALRWAAAATTQTTGAAPGTAMAAAAAEVLLRLGGALARFWQMRGHWDEGRDWLRRALAVPVATFPGDASDLSAWRLRALQGAGSLALYQDDYAFAEHCFAEGLDLARSLGDETQVAVLQGSLGRVTYARGEYAPARRHFEESLRLHRAHGNLPGIAASTGNLALVLEDMNDLAGARALHEESLRLDEALGNTRGVAISLSNLGTVARFQNDYPAARTFYEHAEALYRALGGYRGGEASVLCHRGMVALGENDRERARRLCREGLTRSQELGDRRTVLRALEAFAALAVAEEQNGEAGARRAARLLGAAEALRAEIRASPSAPEQAELDHWLAPARTVLGAAAWDHAREVGRALGWRAAVAEVLETDEA